MKKVILGALSFIAAINMQAQNIVYVDKDATGNGDGTSWADAYISLETALLDNQYATTPIEGLKIWVAEGIYTTAFTGYPFTLTSGESIYGGFVGNETDLSQRDIYSHPTILSADVNQDDSGPASPSNSTMVDNNNHVILLSTSPSTTATDSVIVLDGLIIENARAAAANTPQGGGIRSVETFQKGLTVRNCIIRNNHATSNAAIMFHTSFFDSEFNLINTQIISNLNDVSHSVEYKQLGSNPSSANIVNCLFRGNNSVDITNQAATCGLISNFSNDTMHVKFINNTVSYNIQGVNNTTINAPFALETDSTAYGDISLIASNNIFSENGYSLHMFKVKPNTRTTDAFFDTQNSWNNVVDFYDIDGLQGSQNISSNSPFVDAQNGDFYPALSFLKTGGHVESYDTMSRPDVFLNIDIMGNARFNDQGQLAIGAFQPLSTGSSANVNELDAIDLRLYPNPTNDYVYIESEAIIGEKAMLYNSVGAIVDVFNINNQKYKLDLSTYEKGIYLLKIANQYYRLVKD